MEGLHRFGIEKLEAPDLETELAPPLLWTDTVDPLETLGGEGIDTAVVGGVSTSTANDDGVPDGVPDGVADLA